MWQYEKVGGVTMTGGSRKTSLFTKTTGMYLFMKVLKVDGSLLIYFHSSST